MKPATPEPELSQVAPQFDSAPQQREAATLGVWIFLATELMFFGPLFLGYLYGRTHFPEAFAAASRHTDVLLGTLNTAILLTSSASMIIATVAHKTGAYKLAVRLLLLTALLGVLFLIFKGTEYYKEWHELLFPGPGFSFDAEYAQGAHIFFILYFALTGLHALHLIIGISLTLFFASCLYRGKIEFANTDKIEAIALYWHFVDIVWIFLYPILYLVGRNGS